MQKKRWGASILGVFLVLALITLPGPAGCVPSGGNKLESVLRAGELVVLTRNSPTTYYEGPDGYTGIEYDLATAFADHLGVKVKMRVPPRFSDILPMIARGEGDVAAAGITITDLRSQRVRFGPAYQDIRQQLIYRQGSPHPTRLQDLPGYQLEVVAGSSYEEHLHQLQLLYPTLRWTVNNTVETEELLQQVQEELVQLTIADSNIADLSRQFNTDLRVAFDISQPEQLAWAFPLGEDDSLYREAEKFFRELQASGELAQLVERYYGATTRFNPVNIATYTQRIGDALAEYQPWFEKAGQQYAIDWQLLAAMSYQESFWNPKAVSPTGVRGMMMLTSATAQHLGIADREDPRQSILGGARYIRQLLDRLPQRIREPDRTWMALAAYNVGMHHLEDARIITQEQGGDPDKWNDVKTRLPLLAKAAWHSKTKYGYARGYEPVQFVNRIRLYYGVLQQIGEESRAVHKNDVIKLKPPGI
jgi:membrane-bound lytic murein transglycosylase F